MMIMIAFILWMETWKSLRMVSGKATVSARILSLGFRIRYPKKVKSFLELGLFEISACSNH